jgi:hypothetical protein
MIADNGEGSQYSKRSRNMDDTRSSRPELIEPATHVVVHPLPERTSCVFKPVPLAALTNTLPPQIEGVESQCSKKSKWKPRRGEGQIPEPTVYELLGPLPVAPTPEQDPAPEAGQSLLSPPSDADDNNDDDNGLMEAIEGESKQQIMQREAHNRQICKAHNKKANVRSEALNQCCIFDESRPGRIPDGLGVVMVNQHPKCNNVFFGMLSRHYYYSPITNIVYAGQMAVEAACAKLGCNAPYCPSHHHQLYAVACRGLPMNPHEVCQLAALVTSSHSLDADQVEGFCLFTELERLSQLSLPEHRDRSMEFILSDGAMPPDFHKPYLRDHPIWDHNSISWDVPHWSQLGSQGNAPGMPMLKLESTFDLELWAQYMLYHAWPGSRNAFVGPAFNTALHLHYCSMFSFQLSRALSPSSPHVRATFVRHFTSIAAIPHHYVEFVTTWTRNNPGYTPAPAPYHSIMVMRIDMDDGGVHDMTMDQVAAFLLANGIPISWIDHSYTFGLHYLNHHLDESPGSLIQFKEVDDSHLIQLAVWGVPPAIP